MLRAILICVALCLSVPAISGRARDAVVADSVSRMPLSNASVFDRRGRPAGITKPDGSLPYVAPADYPVTIRHMGYRERTVNTASPDTIFLSESATELPEVTVESRQRRALHILGYVREYSTLTTYFDTVFLFREKMVDYMLPTEKKSRFKGWTNPRILSSRSYYRFTGYDGRDSVSDKCGHHFSWADWIGIPPASHLPERLLADETAADTLRGKYSLSEIWNRSGSRLTVDVNVMADSSARKWVPDLYSFFRGKVDFEQLRIRLNYDNLAGDSVSPADLTGYSFNIESNGRGRGMFMFNRVDERFFVSTYAEVYIIDKEYITVKEARRWERMKIDNSALAIYEPPEAPPLQPAIRHLVERVNSIDRDQVRLTLEPDRLLVGRGVVRQSFGDRVLSLLKTLTGISRARMNRNTKRQWESFRHEQTERNNTRPVPPME